MLYDKTIELYAKFNEAEKLRAAQHRHLIAAVQSARRAPMIARLAIQLGGSALAWLGRELTAAGHRLQQRVELP